MEAPCLHFFRPDAPVAGLSLRATPARGKGGQATRAQPTSPPISWPAMALVGGAVTALASWILCAGVTILGWLAAEPGSLGDALQLGTRLWLLSNGVGVRIGAIPVTLVPWGATAVIAFMISRFAAASARRVRADQKHESCADQRRHGCGLPAARSYRGAWLG